MHNHSSYHLRFLARVQRAPATALLTVILASGIAGQVKAQQAAPQDQKRARATFPFPAALRQRIKYVIVLYSENRSFDSLYGNFPGANGLAQAQPKNYTQVSRVGDPPLPPTLPRPFIGGIPGITSGPDMRFPPSVPNEPFNIAPYVPDGFLHGDMVHKFYTEQYQINSKADRFANDPKSAGGSPMSKYAAWSDNPGLVLGNYDESDGGEGRIGRTFVLCDNAFHSAFGGSFLNHMWLIAARTPVWPANPAEGSAPNPGNATQLDENGYPKVDSSGKLSDGVITNDANLSGFPESNANAKLESGDYWAVNTLRPLRGPADGYLSAVYYEGTNGDLKAAASNTLESSRLPLQTYDTIGDRLTAANISWAWFSGGWKDAKAGKADFLFQFHHQPFAFFAKYALTRSPVPPMNGDPARQGDDSDGSTKHLLDEDADFYSQLADGTLPRVSFVKPIGEDNSHPGYASVKRGQGWVANTLAKIESSPIWPDCVVFITYDEHGGLWDHVQPPVIDEWGPGTRVPMLVASPFSKKGFVDHNQYETVSILNFIEGLYGVPGLNQRDANALPPIAAFEGQPDLIIRAKVGQPVSYQVPAYNNPFAFSGDPGGGLTLDKKTGVITGTPKNATPPHGELHQIEVKGGSEIKYRTLLLVTP